jgi:hypothetical protein
VDARPAGPEVSSGRRARAPRRRAAASVAVSAMLAGAPSATVAESTAECERVRALADSQAALLYAPSLELHGGKLPESVAVEPSVRAGGDVQLRAALSLSLLDVYRARHVERAAEHQCVQLDARRRLESVLIQAADYGRLPALRRTARFLDAHRKRWQEIEQHAQRALAARVVSLLQADEIQKRCLDLERRTVAVAGDITRLEALGATTSEELRLEALLHAADDAALRFERESSGLRSLDAWEVEVVGGAAPTGGSTDYFGVAHLRFSLGAFAQRAAERRVLAARERELRSSRSELREQLQVFRGVGRATRATPPGPHALSRSASPRSVRSARHWRVLGLLWPSSRSASSSSI